MRCPKCYTETPAEAHNCPSCNLATPKGRLAAPKKGSGKKLRLVKKGKFDFKAILPSIPGTKAIFWISSILILGASGYFAYWYTYSDASSLEAKPALEAINQLRHQPSKLEGKNIEDCLTAEINKSKDAGQLVSYQGWTVKPYDRNSYLISFSFEEKEAKKSADWVVDPKNNTFTPVSELASAVQKEAKQN